MGQTSSICCPCLKPQEETITFTPNWDQLPFLVLADVFSRLNERDRMRASAVCSKWRETYLYPGLWKSVEFIIHPKQLERYRFLINNFVSTVTHATIVLNSVSTKYLDEFKDLLNQLANNTNLTSLNIEPLGLEKEYKIPRPVCQTEVMNQLKRCLPKLTEFSICCIQDLPLSIGPILENLNPSIVTILRLASENDNPKNRSTVITFDPELLRRFTKLKVLNISDDHVTEELLDVLKSVKGLKQFIIHHVGTRGNPPYVSKKAWKNFKKHYAPNELRFTICFEPDHLDYIEHSVFYHVPITRLMCYFKVFPNDTNPPLYFDWVITDG